MGGSICARRTTHTDAFSATPVQDAIGRQVEVIRESLEWEHQAVPGIAMILDDAARLETNGSGTGDWGPGSGISDGTVIMPTDGTELGLAWAK